MPESAQWFAAVCEPQREHKVVSVLSQRGVESYLPCEAPRAARAYVHSHLRYTPAPRPLFPGYVFVHCALSARFPVVSTPHLVSLLGFGQGPVAIPDEQIESLRIMVAHAAMPCPFLAIGERVAITDGPLAGVQGVLVERCNALDVIVSVPLLGRSCACRVDAKWVSACF